MKILGFAGSLRKRSYNRALLVEAQKRLSGLEIFDLGDLPLYNGDVEDLGDPEAVTAWKAAIRGSDALLIATPEYNGCYSGVLKNALDWASREKGIFKGKSVGVMGASSGAFGTARAQHALFSLLTYFGAHTIHPTLYVGLAEKKFGENLELLDARAIEKLDELCKLLSS